MQRQPSFPFSRLPGEHIKHMPSAPEAMKNKSTNKWISNHKGKKNKEPLNYVGKTGLSEQFLCFWAFCDNPKCILGNMSGAKSLISLDLCSLFFFWSSNMLKGFSGLVLCMALLGIWYASLPTGFLYLSQQYGAKNTPLLVGYLGCKNWIRILSWKGATLMF